MQIWLTTQCDLRIAADSWQIDHHEAPTWLLDGPLQGLRIAGQGRVYSDEATQS